LRLEWKMKRNYSLIRGNRVNIFSVAIDFQFT
jgi:hypothetical protein